jgi:hypothetical protein
MPSLISCFLSVLLAARVLSPAQTVSGPPVRQWTPSPFWSPAWQSRGDQSRSHLHPAPEKVTAPSVVPPVYGLVSVAPCRQYDSRNSTPLPHASLRTITLTGSPCNIPSAAAAISVDISVFNINGATGNGVFQVGIPSGTSIAWLNYPPAQSQIDNAGTVPVDGSGNVQVEVFQGAGSVDFVVDVNGYYALLPFGVRTVLVSPVGTPAQNGTALLSALAGITTNSAGNPWLLKVEPGLYDLGSSPLIMKPYVDLEGSGEITTIITAASLPGSGTVSAASNSQIRFVTVRNTGGGASAIGVGAIAGGGNIMLLHATVIASGGTGNNIGIFVGGFEGVNSESVTVNVSGSGSSPATGIQGGPAVTLAHSRVTVSGGTANTGVFAGSSGGGSPDLSDVTIMVDGPAGSQNTGFNSFKAGAAVRNSQIAVTGGSQATGIAQQGNNTDIRNSTVTARLATTASYGMTISTAITSGIATVNNSTIVGDTSYIGVGATCSAFVGASQLKGGSVTGGGTAVCAGVFDGSYTFFASTCP